MFCFVFVFFGGGGGTFAMYPMGSKGLVFFLIQTVKIKIRLSGSPDQSKSSKGAL